MLATSIVHRCISNTLFLTLAASGIHATEQAARHPHAETTQKSNYDDPITSGSQCEARTINYVTHSLPQSCLTNSWVSIASAVVDNTPPFTTADPTLSDKTELSISTDSTWAKPSAFVAETKESESIEAGPATESFMSFEDWKEMMVQKNGQDPQDPKHRRGTETHSDERQKTHPNAAKSGEDSETSFDLGVHGDNTVKEATDNDTIHGDEHADEQLSEVGQPNLHRNKDAGKTCKERFSFASFDAGATILKTSAGAKNSKAILVENKDTYMLLECAAQSKYVIIELTDDIWVDTIVLANFEFFSSMIRHFRVSVSDRYPVKLDKWRELGTFEARNSRDIQAFLVENPQIWAKYLRLEFLTHYSNEYYCPVSLIRVHGSRMLDKWKDSETGTEEDAIGELEGEAESYDAADSENPNSSDLEESKALVATPTDISIFIDAISFQLCLPMCPVIKISTSPNNSEHLKEDASIAQHGKSLEEHLTEVVYRQATVDVPLQMVNTETKPPTAEISNTTNSPSATVEDGRNGDSVRLKNLKPVSAEASSSSSWSSPAAAPAKSSVTPVSSNRPRSNGTNAANPPPTMQEGFFNSVTKRLQQVETNLTLSLKYVEEQSKHVQDAFQRAEQKQLLKISSVLNDLNQTVLAELRNFRDQYDQIWQSTVLALESQKGQSQRDILALSARLHVLADEVVFQKRMAIVQAVLLLSCLLLVIFSRGVPIPYLGSPSDQGLSTSAAFAEILASMQRRDMYPGGSPRYPPATQTPRTPDPQGADSPSEIHMPSPPINMDDYSYQRPSPPLTPNTKLDDSAPNWQPAGHSSAIETVGYEIAGRRLSSRKPLPALPEDLSSPG